MPRFIIERDIPGASNFTADQLHEMAKKSCQVIQQMSSGIQWVHSYVTADKIYSVYIAPNREWIQEHTRKAGFPANAICEITMLIDPVTAEK